MSPEKGYFILFSCWTQLIADKWPVYCVPHPGQMIDMRHAIEALGRTNGMLHDNPHTGFEKIACFLFVG